MLNNVFQAFLETLLIVLSSGLIILLFGSVISIWLSSNYLNNPNSRLMIWLKNIMQKLEQTYYYLPFAAIFLLLTPIAKRLSYEQNIYFAVIPLTIFILPDFIARSFNIITKTSQELQDIYSFYTSNKYGIVLKVYLPESINNILGMFFNILTILVGYSAIIGFIGAPGLGKILYEKGIQTFDLNYLLLTTLCLVFTTKLIIYSKSSLLKV